MELKGKRVAIFIDSLYQEMEVWYPFFRLQEAHVEVSFIAAEPFKAYNGKFGYPAKSSLSYEQAKTRDYDGVVIPGGYAPDHIRRYMKANQFVRDMNAEGKLVAAICHGPWVLCSADILKGRRATSFSAIKDDVVHAGAIYEDAEVVVDWNLVTSRKPEDLPAFCKACVKVLAAGPVVPK
ncbi:MAG TPA: type 1 glutamine amidotransferase domain-containing protein [Bryobacteraceae bacterium]|nr:type 1 glutamine amidotransferase domain-containing protein [Bryobacteraceae bacterium]